MPSVLSQALSLPRLSQDLREPVKPICIGLEPADLARLDLLSRQQRVNRSALVRRAIKAFLAAKGTKG